MIAHYRFRLLCTLMVLALLPSRFVRADVVLKPNGQSGYPLRTKALKADAVIDGPFAATRLIFTFQNETSERIEADFLYTLPPDTVVTYFAYWFGSEKVVARIVEKEKAAAIYQHITSRMRDPALVEMVGKDTFRARIFPVMPNADLQVEMILMQVLPSQGRNIGYSFPLGAEKKQTYDRLDFRVAWRRDSGIERYASNYDANMTLEKDFARFRLNGTNFRPPKDLRITAVRAIKPLHTELYAAPSGGSGGFFALALTPDHSLTRPTVQIDGVTTSDILPVRLPDTKPGSTLRLFGRYKGSGPATITLIGTSNGEPVWYSQKVNFSSKSVTNNIASKLWAWWKIEQLSANDANRNAVIALSKRFLLPSKFTSWLAVPKLEMERYRNEKEIEDVCKEITRQIIAGRSHSRSTEQLRSRLDWLGRRTNRDGRSELQQFLYSAADGIAREMVIEIVERGESTSAARRLRGQINRIYKELGYEKLEMGLPYGTAFTVLDMTAERLAEEIRKGRGQTLFARQLHVRLNRLAKHFKTDPQNELHSHLSNDFYAIAEPLSKLILAGQENSPQGKTLQAKWSTLCRQSGIPSRKALRYSLDFRLETLAYEAMQVERGKTVYWTHNDDYELVAQEYTDANHKPDLARARTLRQELERLARTFGQTGKEYLRPVEIMWKQQEAEQVRSKLLTERRKPTPNIPTIQQLEAQYSTLNREIGGEKYAKARHRRLVLKLELEKLDALRKQSKVNQKEIETRYAALQRESQELLSRLNTEMRETSQVVESPLTGMRVRRGDPLIQVEAPEDAEQVIALLPGGEIKRLLYNAESQKWEARFDIPAYASEGEFGITILIVRKDGTRQTLVLRYQVDVTPPAGTGRALAVTIPQPTLRLELDASEDTARVTALLPWDETIPLTRSTQTANQFIALVPVPEVFQNKIAVVTFILTDKAHNRTTVTVNLEKGSME